MKKFSTSLTITTREFLTRYLGVDYTLDKHLTHKGMKMILVEKKKKLPKRVSIDHVNFEDIATGKYLLVRAESAKKKKSQIIAYKNPDYKSGMQLLEELDVSEKVMRKRREEILKEQGLEYDAFSIVQEIEHLVGEEYEDYNVMQHISRTAMFQKSFHKSKKRK
mgnify:FL=1